MGEIQTNQPNNLFKKEFNGGIDLKEDRVRLSPLSYNVRRNTMPSESYGQVQLHRVCLEVGLH